MRRTIACLFALAVAGAAASAEAQSFDCRKAHYPDEMVICDDRGLSMLDESLAAVFTRNMNLLPPRERRALAREEEGWVIARRQCGYDYHCIAHAYRVRIEELRGMLAQLERQPPSAATADKRARGKPGKAARNERKARPRAGSAAKPRSTEIGAATRPGRLESKRETQRKAEPPRASTHARRAEPQTAQPQAAEPKPTLPAAATAAPSPPQPLVSSGGGTSPRIEWIDPPPVR
jgi:uncharacterized protein